MAQVQTSQLHVLSEVLLKMRLLQESTTIVSMSADRMLEPAQPILLRWSEQELPWMTGETTFLSTTEAMPVREVSTTLLT